MTQHCAECHSRNLLKIVKLKLNLKIIEQKKYMVSGTFFEK